MIPGANMMPAMMLIAGIGVSATVGKKVVNKVVNTVKSGLTESELSGICDQLKQEYIYGENLNELAQNHDAFVEMVQELMTSDKRDPSIDLWGSDYEFSVGNEDHSFMAYSLGANGHEDGACDAGGNDYLETWEEQIDEMDSWGEEGGLDDFEEVDLNEPDDICREFLVSPTDRSPYKRL